MKIFLKNNFSILFLYLLAVLYALFLMLNVEKVFLHVYMNRLVGNPVVDVFFYYVTYLGDGLVAPFLLLIIVVYNVRLGIAATISFLSATILAQILKHFFFDDLNRPTYTFNYDFKYPLTYVEGVETFIHNSFPSGHATQGFSILMCLAFFSKNQLVKIMFFFLALLTALSRVYLSQHWLNDITAGSAIGMFFSCLFFYIFIQKNKFERLNKPLMSLVKF